MIVTLLTDFGTADHFVGAMKGVILQRDPRIRIVDITHEVAPHDIHEAAYLLLSCYRDFPSGTVHLAVVDPGVGSNRRPLAISTSGYRFVGPDNGIFSYVLDDAGPGDVHAIANPALRREPLSTTFHGRDLFAPAAAFLACGGPMAEVGPDAGETVSLETLRNRVGEGTVEARILHVDRFGNCVTSLRRADLGAGSWRLRIGEVEIGSVREHYGAGATGEPFAIWGSSGFLEISLRGASAASGLGLRRGQRVTASIV